MITLIEQAAAPAPVEQVSPPRVAELGKTISPSRLSLWLQCKLKFYFRYVLQVPRPPTPSKHAGSTVHEVLRSWNMARWRNKALSLKRSKRLFSSQWAALQSGLRIDWEEGEAPAWHSTWAALELYLKETPIPADEKPEAVEARIEADLSRHGFDPVFVEMVFLDDPQEQRLLLGRTGPALGRTVAVVTGIGLAVVVVIIGQESRFPDFRVDAMLKQGVKPAAFGLHLGQFGNFGREGHGVLM